jgi:hypothetical protein
MDSCKDPLLAVRIEGPGSYPTVLQEMVVMYPRGRISKYFCKGQILNNSVFAGYIVSATLVTSAIMAQKLT